MDDINQDGQDFNDVGKIKHVGDLLKMILADLMIANINRRTDLGFVIFSNEHEFYYSPPHENEFHSLQGDQKITRDNLPEDFGPGKYMVLPIEHYDQMLDLHNDLKEIWAMEK